MRVQNSPIPAVAPLGCEPQAALLCMSESWLSPSERAGASNGATISSNTDHGLARGTIPLIRTVVAAGTDTELIGLQLVELDGGGVLERTCEAETVVVVLRGVVDAQLNGASLGRAGGRESVFESAGYAIYAPPGTQLRVTTQAGAELAIADAPLLDGRPASARVITPADQRITEVGEGNWARSVRTILGPEHAAGRLLVGETVNPPGNWSSYPPHKHDEQAPPDEVRLEEVYLFKVEPPEGFGVQIRYDQGGEHIITVRNNDAVVIRAGYHPVVAAPGYSLYYLWVMAGEGRELIQRFDPAHSWLQANSITAVGGITQPLTTERPRTT
jgi:5-deoxy-glucuronate isomerase